MLVHFFHMVIVRHGILTQLISVPVITKWCNRVLLFHKLNIFNVCRRVEECVRISISFMPAGTKHMSQVTGHSFGLFQYW